MLKHRQFFMGHPVYVKVDGLGETLLFTRTKSDSSKITIENKENKNSRRKFQYSKILVTGKI